MSIEFTHSDSESFMTLGEMRQSIPTFLRLGHALYFNFYQTNTGTYKLYLHVYSDSDDQDPQVILLSLSRGGVREFKTFEALLAVYRSICEGNFYSLIYVP